MSDIIVSGNHAFSPEDPGDEQHLIINKFDLTQTYWHCCTQDLPEIAVYMELCEPLLMWA